jgi:hypothetical protein
MRYGMYEILSLLASKKKLKTASIGAVKFLEVELDGLVVPVIFTNDRGDSMPEKGEGEIQGQYHYGDVPPGITIYGCDFFDRTHLRGNLVHELAHALQDYHCGYVGSLLCNEQQRLYDHHYYTFGDTYAQECPLEASAEVFRHLMGYHRDWDSQWAQDALLKDYWDFWEPILKSL